MRDTRTWTIEIEHDGRYCAPDFSHWPTFSACQWVVLLEDEEAFCVLFQKTLTPGLPVHRLLRCAECEEVTR